MLAGPFADTVTSQDLLYFQLLNEDTLSIFSLTRYRLSGRGAVSVPFSSVLAWGRGEKFLAGGLSYTQFHNDETVRRYMTQYNPESQMVLMYEDAEFVTEQFGGSMYNTQINSREGAVFAALARIPNVEPDPGDWEI